MPDNNVLHTAAKKGDLAEVQSQVGSFEINAKGEEDGTALYWAAREGHTDAVKLLLTFNADVNIPDVRKLKKMISVQLICISLTSILLSTHLVCIVITRL